MRADDSMVAPGDGTLHQEQDALAAPDPFSDDLAAMERRRPPPFERLARWWFDDLPPLPGPLRAVFYAGLLALALTDPESPLRAIAQHAETAPELYAPQGVLAVLGVPFLAPGLLAWLIGATILAWLASVVGLLDRPARVAVAAGMVLLHGLFYAGVAFDSGWVLPVLALAALALARCDDPLSVDAALLDRPHEPRPGTLGSSGFARQLVLVAVALSSFVEGCAKLGGAGAGWATGETLAWHAGRADGWFPALVEGEGGLAFAAAWLTALTQLCSPLALARLRPLRLFLVTNPVGAILPAGQGSLEAEWKREMSRLHGIEFDALYTITNLPISRYLEWLADTGNLEPYLCTLVDAFNPHAAEGVMCRSMISVDWSGGLHDCDFNQMLEMGLAPGLPRTLEDFDVEALSTREILTGRHCFGCTAGAGSSCGGSLA